METPKHNPGEPEFGEHDEEAPHNPGEPSFEPGEDEAEGAEQDPESDEDGKVGGS